jgi:hypothetical protein
MNPIPKMDNAKYMARDFFTVEMDATAAIAPGGQQNIVTTIDSDADFFWMKGCVFADVGGASTTYAANILPNCLVTITYGSTGRALSNAPVPVSSLFGTAQLPFILPAAKYFPARSLITFVVTNPGNATYSNVRFSLHGVKAFLVGGG